MARDAFDPGPLNTYPYFPRKSDGSPAWSDSALTDGIPVDSGVAPMPRGLRKHRAPDGTVYLIDMTPTDANGQPINPPTLPPA